MLMFLKIILFSFIALSLNACVFFKDDEVNKPLLSQIDGKEYYKLQNGEMNAQKACIYIIDGLKDSINYNLKIDLLDSLEAKDIFWRNKYFKAINIILSEVKEGQSERLEELTFSYFLHFPNEFISNLNSEGFNNIDNWMAIMSSALKKATYPDDITSTSVINASLSNCNECNENDKELIVRFVQGLENFD